MQRNRLCPQLAQTINVPTAKDDRLIAVANRPVVAKILGNDIDPDGNNTEDNICHISNQK